MAAAQAKTHNNFIDGQWVGSISGRTYDISNPAKKSTVVGEFQSSGEEDALRAVAAAKNALPAWAETPPPARAAVLFRAISILDSLVKSLCRSN